jgi:hypothetical protein
VQNSEQKTGKVLCRLAHRGRMLRHRVSSTFRASAYTEIHKNRIRNTVVLCQYHLLSQDIRSLAQKERIYVVLWHTSRCYGTSVIRYVVQ